MVCEILPGIYLSEIPLPGNPLKALNSYIIISKHRNLIIDTGFNMDACQEALMHGIRELDVDLSQTDLLLTHMHADHAGLADELARLGANVFIHAKDGELINRSRMTDQSIFMKMNGALGLSTEVNAKNLSFGKRIREPLQYQPLREGDVFEIGPYALEVLEIPGHSPGHIGLYDKKQRIFFCGDHILNEISPNITTYDLKHDYLGTFFRSLEKVYVLDIDYTFPGHRSIIRDHRLRITELKAHHEQRLREILEILAEGKRTVRDTASEMHWDLSYDTFEEFPGTQKWFASGEAMAHLQHLVTLGLVRRTDDGDVIYYELCEEQ